MASIVNLQNVGVSIYNDFHPDSAETKEIDYNVSIPEIKADSGSMDNEISDHMSEIRAAAMKKKYKKRYHWTTKNKSFIELHKTLKALGIENNKFFLALYDQELENVDPYNIFTPLETQARIVRECMINPWYFLREIARVPEDGKPITPGGGTMFQIDRNSVATWYLFLNGIDCFSSKPRQCGKTVDAIMKINYAYHFGCMSSTITFGNKDSTLNKMNLSRLKAQRDLLPLYLQMKTAVVNETMDINVSSGENKIIKGTENVTSMKNPVTKNTIQLLPIANSEARADGLGRGFTSAIQLWDEFEWMPFGTRVIDTSVFAYNTASDNARKNGSLYGRLFTSTPGNLDSRDGQAADVFIRGDENSKPMLKWTDQMLDMPINKLKEMVRSRAYNGIVFVEHGWKELKKSLEWYEKACRGVRYNPEQIAREIQLMRLRGTSKSPFKRSDIMQLIHNMDEVMSQVDYSDNCSPICFYEKMDRRLKYIIAIDPAEGLAGDNMAMVVISPYTEKIVAEFKSPYIHQTKMSRLLVKFMDNYCPKAMIVIENNKGRELIHAMQETRYASQIWYDVDKLEGKEMVDESAETRMQKALGFNTSTKTRPLLYNLLETMVAEENEKINGRMVVDDICALERNPNTMRIAAAQGKHDDMIMAYLIGLFVFRSASNLEDWGIYRGMTLPSEHKEQTPVDLLKKITELAKMMPPEMQKYFIAENKDPVTEAAKYAKEVDRELQRFQAAKDARDELLGYRDEYEEPSYGSLINADDPLNEKVFYDDIASINEYNRDRDFDINDWI